MIDVLTHKNVGGRRQAGKLFAQKGYMGTSIAPLASDQVLHDRPDRRRRHRRHVRGGARGRDAPGHFLRGGDARPPRWTAAASRSKRRRGAAEREGTPAKEKPKVGDAAGALAEAPVTVDAWYETPTQHHNPIELFTTTASWDGSKLTIWESSQNMVGFQHGVAEQLGIDPADVHVISPFVAGPSARAAR